MGDNIELVENGEIIDTSNYGLLVEKDGQLYEVTPRDPVGNDFVSILEADEYNGKKEDWD